MKRCMELYFPFPFFYCSFLFSFRAGNRECKKRKLFLNTEKNSERGFLLLTLVIWIPLLFTVLAISFHEVQRAQKRVALQSRLDICSVKRTEQRKKMIQKIVQANDVIRFTNVAVASLRGISVLTGPLGSMASRLGESVLIQTNRAAALFQSTLLKTIHIAEMIPTCEPTAFSKEPAFCTTTPGVTKLFFRASKSMPDLEAPLLARSSLLSMSNCIGGLLSTKINLYGDAKLVRTNFREGYEK